MKNVYPHFAIACLGCLLLLFQAGKLSAQDTLYYENFEGPAPAFTLNTADVGGSTNGYNDWVINNSYTGGSGTLVCLGFPFNFTVNNTPTQPAFIAGAPTSFYLHITADAAVSSGISNSNYQPADGTCQTAESNFARMSNDISTAGRTGVTLSFAWIGVMSSTSVGEVHYSTNSGTSWTQLTQPISQYFGQSTWGTQSVTDPTFDNQPTLRFGFRFLNNVSSTGADPGFGIDDIVVTAASGCTATNITVQDSICDGDSLFVGGAFQTTAGTYVDSLVAGTGCDSVITTELAVNAAPLVSATASICEGDTIFLGGAPQTNAGVYTDVFPLPSGCDSIVVTTLTVDLNATNSAAASICDGDSVFAGGAFQTTAGTYTDIFTAANGCDSILTTTVTLLPNSVVTVADTICEGDSILLGGAFQTAAGTYTDVLTNTDGCDSTVTTNLAVSVVDATVSQNGGILIANQNGASYQWIDCGSGMAIAGEAGQTFASTMNGNYAVDVTLNGCTIRSECESIILESVLENTLGTSLNAWPNPVSGELHLELGRIAPEMNWEVFDLQGKRHHAGTVRGQMAWTVDVSEMASGLYTLRVWSNKGQALLKVVKE